MVRRSSLSNGSLSMRFMEPMEEVNYIDQLRLVAVIIPKTSRSIPTSASSTIRLSRRAA